MLCVCVGGEDELIVGFQKVFWFNWAFFFRFLLLLGICNVTILMSVWFYDGPHRLFSCFSLLKRNAHSLKTCNGNWTKCVLYVYRIGVSSTVQDNENACQLWESSSRSWFNISCILLIFFFVIFLWFLWTCHRFIKNALLHSENSVCQSVRLRRYLDFNSNNTIFIHCQIAYSLVTISWDRDHSNHGKRDKKVMACN